MKKVSVSHTHFMLYAKYHYEKSEDKIADLIKIYERFYHIPEQVIENDLTREYCIRQIFFILRDMVWEYYLNEPRVNPEARFQSVVQVMRENSHDVGYIFGFLPMIAHVVVLDELELAEEADETLLPLSEELIRKRMESLDNTNDS